MDEVIRRKSRVSTGDVVRSLLTFPKQYEYGVVLEVKPLQGKKYSAEVYWDDGHVRGTMTRYLEVVAWN